MLRWSSEATGRPVDIRAVADQTVVSGLEGGDELSGLARTASQIVTPDTTAVCAVADALGDQAASDATAVAAAFEGLNRIVDGTGLPIGRAARRDQADIIDLLGLSAFPHAGHGA